MDIRVYAKSGGQVVIERGNLGKVVLEIPEAHKVMQELPYAIKEANHAVSPEERERQIKEHEAAIARLKAPPLAQTKEGPAVRIGQIKEKS